MRLALLSSTEIALRPATSLQSNTACSNKCFYLPVDIDILAFSSKSTQSSKDQVHTVVALHPIDSETMLYRPRLRAKDDVDWYKPWVLATLHGCVSEFYQIDGGKFLIRLQVLLLDKQFSCVLRLKADLIKVSIASRDSPLCHSPS